MKYFKPKISISLQISIFLVLVAFIPVIVMMALNTYEKQLLEMFESTNVQEARIVSAALQYTGNDSHTAEAILTNMEGRFVSRIRILDSEGKLLADSSVLTDKKRMHEKESESSDMTDRSMPDGAETDSSVQAQDSLVYRFFSLPVRIYRKLFRRPVQSVYDTADFYNKKTVYDGEEILEALSGRYGARTRISSGNQVSVTLYSAVPVFASEGEVQGVVLVSRSTYRILRNLYELRRDLALIYLKSLIAVMFIAVFFAFRITRPLKKLSREATQCADKKGRIFFTTFTGHKRIDEIGELSRSFSSLIERLNKRIQFSQAFSSDISHEFKNPLAAIRCSAEVLSDSEVSDEERSELSSAIVEEVSHLEVLLTGVRNISRIDAGEELCNENISVKDFLQNITDRVQKKYPETEFSLEAEENLQVSMPLDYLDRLAENLIDNAGSFGTKVHVDALKENKNFVLRVQDNGRGLTEEQVQKIFNRFYSERDGESKNSHTGLGLSTVKVIVDAMEGEITAGKSQAYGGAEFTVKIPVVK